MEKSALVRIGYGTETTQKSQCLNTQSWFFHSHHIQPGSRWQSRTAILHVPTCPRLPWYCVTSISTWCFRVNPEEESIWPAVHLLVRNLTGPEVTMSALDSLLARVAKACPTVRRGEELKILVMLTSSLTSEWTLKSWIIRVDTSIYRNETDFLWF